ncbi:molybdopterin synthase [Natronomonas sp. EA1]|uniref:molybdopterin synthase n=1 Tax=Natronomonas sp. EA1 TaxID=3421655 RepID=UPI003EB9DE84
MHAFGIIGPDAEAVADSLVAELDGRVAVVRNAAADGGLQSPRPATTYALDEDGWQATGQGGSLHETLDRLATDHDYAIAIGFPEARLPQVCLGDATAEQTLAAAVDAAVVDYDEVIDAIEALEPYETLESLVAQVKRSPRADESGAIATFTGRVRAKEHPDDERTEFLEFEKYDGVAEKRLAKIEAELEDREGVLDVTMHHRVGVIPDGEDIVFVVVLAAHRTEAFRAVEDGINRLKDEVPIFKKEVTETETFWVHERD